MRPGTIWMCDFGSPLGREPGFQRPALVISPEEINHRALPVVLPITRGRRGYPTHVELDGSLPVTSYVQCELIRAISSDRLIRQVGAIDPIDALRVNKILRHILCL